MIVGIAVIGTGVAGMIVKRRNHTGNGSDNLIPRPVITKATASVVATGTNLDFLGSVLPNPQIGVTWRKIAGRFNFWLRVHVPGGLHNYPRVTFEVQGDHHRKMAIRWAWLRDDVYVLLAKGYSVVPSQARFLMFQGNDRLLDYALPSLPAPIPLPVPKLLPAWSGVSAYQVSTLNCPPQEVTIGINAPRPKTGFLLAEVIGSSANPREPNDGTRFNITPPPPDQVRKYWAYASPNEPVTFVINVGLFYPAETKTLYLRIMEAHRAKVKIPASDDANAPLVEVRRQVYGREAILAIPLNKPYIPFISRFVHGSQIGRFGFGPAVRTSG